MLCAEPDGPCGVCRSCRKVLGGSHPDYITVDAPDKKIIPVQLVRDIRADVYIKPNEGARKIYLFPRAQDLNTEGQNTLLKILEEPPSYGVFLLLCENPEKLLPTVRSRATALQLLALDSQTLCQELSRRFPETDQTTIRAAAERSGGYLGQAIQLLEQGDAVSPQLESFVAGFGQKLHLQVLNALAPMEKWDRERFAKELIQWQQILQQALLCRSGVSVTSEHARLLGSQRSSAELLQALRHIQKAIEYAQGNVSVAAICGHLTWVLR